MNIGIVTTSFGKSRRGAKFDELSEIFRRSGHIVHVTGRDFSWLPLGARTARIFTSLAARKDIRRLDKLVDIYLVDDYHGLFFNRTTAKRFILFLPVTYATFIRKMKAMPRQEKNRYIDFLQYCLFPFFEKVQSQACRNAARIITTCEESSKSLQEDYHIEKSRISVIPAAVDIVKFNPSCDPSRWKKKLGITGRKIILSIGQPFFLKGTHYLVRAFGNILREHNNAVLVIVGQKSRFYDSSIRKLISEMGIGDKVIFLGSCPHEEIPYLCAAADVFTHVSICEGTSRAILEAMACAKAILATDVGGTAEIISRGSEGILVGAMNVPEIEAGLSLLLADSELRRRLGANARLRTEKYFSWDVLGKRILNLCDNLVRSE